MPNRLIKGFQKFRHDAYEASDLMHGLVKSGQDPDLFIISCIDSRSNPGTVFNARPGTFFSHKAMGAIVRPYKQGTALAAALQFALNYNHVKHIIVLGHTGCGAIKALIDGIEDEEIRGFIDVAHKALEKAKTNTGYENDLARCAEEQIILQSVENLKQYPAVEKALAEERIKILPWLFDMKEGAIYEYAGDTCSFKKLT